MTLTQITILLHIRRGINGHWDLRRAMGYEPTSGGNVSDNINRLKEQGFVTWEPNKARTLQLTEAGRAAVSEYVLLPGGGVGRWEGVSE